MTIRKTLARTAAIAVIAAGGLAVGATTATAGDGSGSPSGGLAPMEAGGSPGSGVAPADHEWGIATMGNNDGAPGSGLASRDDGHGALGAGLSPMEDFDRDYAFALMPESGGSPGGTGIAPMGENNGAPGGTGLAPNYDDNNDGTYDHVAPATDGDGVLD